MTGAELTERCKNRCFDQIVIVVKDIFQKMENMQKIQKELPGRICLCTQNDQPLFDAQGQTIDFAEKSATYYFANTSLRFVEPVKGDTLYSRFLEKHGEGICCIRERLTDSEMETFADRMADKGFAPVQTMAKDDVKASWFDITEDLGILYEVITGSCSCSEKFPHSEARIAQVNISTPHVQKTIERITELFEIGPWEVGRQRNAVAHDTAFTVDGEFKDQDFSFLLAILVCGNIEWEVIEPEIGQLVYSEFIERRGIGFHHVLQEIPQAKWQERLDTYAKDGVRMNCKGSLGPADWCYMDTEKQLGFYMELRTDAVMEKLPDGYLQYYYPED